MSSRSVLRTLAPFLAPLLALAAAAGCGGGEQASTAAEAPRTAVAVETAVAAPTQATEGIDVTGTLAAKYSADVKAEIPGRITEVLVTEWVAVARGTPLARTDATDILLRLNQAQAAVDAARAGVAEAETAAARAEREKARMAKLRENGLATTQEAENVDTEAEAAASRVESAKARLAVSTEDLAVARRTLDKTTVVSPIDGVIASRSVNVGDIPGDKPLFQVVDNRVLELNVTVPTSEMSKVRAGQTLSFATEALPGRAFEARVRQVNPSVNQADRTVGVLAEVDNPGNQLLSGLFVKGRILTSAPRTLVQVPRSALSDWDLAGKTASLLVVKDGIARLRPVTTGAVLGETVEIAGGLAAGESFVVRGGFLVKDGDPVKPVSAAAGKEG